MSLLRNNPIIKRAVLFIYIIILIEAILKLLGYFTSDTLIISSFYINYEGGFIKRGLLGSILYFLAENVSINPFKLQIFFIVVLILLLFSILFRYFYKNKLDYYILFGSFMLLNVIAYNMFFFVDILLILFFILQIFIIKKIKNNGIKIVVVNLLNIFMILNHEAYFIFTFFPILYLLNVDSFTLKNIKKIIFLFPSFLVFLLVGIYFNGHNVDEHIIVNSWAKFGNDYSDKISKLYWTFNSTDETIIWKIPIFKKTPLYLLGFSANTILIFMSMYVYLSKNFTSKSKYIFTFLSCQYLALILLSIIAFDYVRWFWITNIITIITLINVNVSSGIFKPINLKIPNNINSYNKILILFIGLPLGESWSPTQFIYTMPIKHIFDFGNRLLSLFT